MIHLRCTSAKLTFPSRHWLHCCLWPAYSCSLILLLAASLVACTASGASSVGTSTRTPGFTATPKASLTPTVAVPTISTTLVTYKGHSNNIDGVVWSPDSQRIASCSDDGTLQVWEAQTGKPLWKAPLTRYVFAVAWSPNGAWIAAGGFGGELFLLNATTGHQQASYESQSDFIQGLAWSPDSRYLASGSQDSTVKVWDVQTGKPLLTYTGHTDAVGHVAWSPGGRRIASASHDGTVQIWDATTGHRDRSYRGNGAPVWSVAWSPDGKRIVLGTEAQGAYGPVTTNNSDKVWDSTTGQTLLTYTGHAGQVYGLAWSPDGRRIASGGDDTIVRVWDATSGQTILFYRGHTDVVLSVAWSPDGRLIASSGNDQTVQVWRPQV